MFWISKCRTDQVLVLCTFWEREPRNAKFRFFLRVKHVFFRKSPVRSGSLFTSTTTVHRPPLQFDTRNIQQIYKEKYEKALGVCFPQPCSKVCRVKIPFTVPPTHCYVSTTKISKKCVVNWIPLKIRVRSRNTQTHLNASRRTKFALPRGVFACDRDGSTPFYQVCFSSVGNTQALLTYLNFNARSLQ